jgi:hypothetical protein
MRTNAFTANRNVIFACAVFLSGGAFSAAVGDWVISDPADNTQFSYDASISGDGQTDPGVKGWAFTASVSFAGGTIINSASGTSSSTTETWSITVPVRTGGKWHAPAPGPGANNAQFNVTPAGGSKVLTLILIDQDP